LSEQARTLKFKFKARDGVRGNIRSTNFQHQISDTHLLLEQWFLTFPTQGTPIPKDIGLRNLVCATYKQCAWWM